MLEMPEEAFPGGLPTAEIAATLYEGSGMEARAKVARLAKSLRHLGYRVYGLGGMYYICTPEKLDVVNRRFQKMTCGFLLGAADTAKGIEEAGDAERPRLLRREIKRNVTRILEAL
jgi:hypothetical protein